MLHKKNVLCGILVMVSQIYSTCNATTLQCSENADVIQPGEYDLFHDTFPHDNSTVVIVTSSTLRFGSTTPCPVVYVDHKNSKGVVINTYTYSMEYMSGSLAMVCRAQFKSPAGASYDLANARLKVSTPFGNIAAPAGAVSVTWTHGTNAPVPYPPSFTRLQLLNTIAVVPESYTFTGLRPGETDRVDLAFAPKPSDSNGVGSSGEIRVSLVQPKETNVDLSMEVNGSSGRDLTVDTGPDTPVTGTLIATVGVNAEPGPWSGTMNVVATCP